MHIKGGYRKVEISSVDQDKYENNYLKIYGIPCVECKEKISKKAKLCPFCSAPQKSQD